MPSTTERTQRRSRVPAVLIGLLAGLAVAAGGLKAQDLVIDLSNPIVAITAGFTGTDLLLFGATSQDGDVAVVVRGPQENHTVRRKDRVVGVWVNKDEVTFTDLPSYYAISSNRPIEEFVPEEDASIHQIGTQHLTFKPLVTLNQVDDVEAFRDALLRIKESQGLYGKLSSNLSFLGHGLFRTDIHFPANVTVGTYGIDVYLFNEGELIDTQTTLLNVRKFGAEASIYDFAHRYSFAYGVLAVVIAVMAGWLANAAFNRR